MVGPWQGVPLSNYDIQQQIWYKGGLLGEGRGVRTWERVEAASEP